MFDASETNQSHGPVRTSYRLGFAVNLLLQAYTAERVANRNAAPSGSKHITVAPRSREREREREREKERERERE